MSYRLGLWWRLRGSGCAWRLLFSCEFAWRRKWGFHLWSEKNESEVMNFQTYRICEKLACASLSPWDSTNLHSSDLVFGFAFCNFLFLFFFFFPLCLFSLLVCEFSKWSGLPPFFFYPNYWFCIKNVLLFSLILVNYWCKQIYAVN